MVLLNSSFRVEVLRHDEPAGGKYTSGEHLGKTLPFLVDRKTCRAWEEEQICASRLPGRELSQWQQLWSQQMTLRPPVF